jgi:hypothetical protein
MNSGGSRLSRLIALPIFFGCLSTLFAQTTYYVATNGSSSNDGVSTNTPWPLSYALDNVGPSNTIIVMPGTWSGTEFIIGQPGITLQSQVKWGARIINSPGDGIAVWTGSTPPCLHDVTIDGFEVESPAKHGITIYADSNCIVRNCWVHHIATNGTGEYQGIDATLSSTEQEGQLNVLIENNLIEDIGSPAYAKFCHCMYLAGTNFTVRNNICRYATGNGIQINDNTNLLGSKNIQLYNNLCYNNAWCQIVLGSQYGSVYANLYCNICYNPTNVVGTNSATCTAIGMYTPNGTCSATLTNNILIGGGGTLYEGVLTASVASDYNIIGRIDYMPLTAHSILTTFPGFVNTNNGLYWVAANSPVRGAAFATACGTNDFFGNPQSSVTDIGAFQYNVLYNLDTRALDPSPACPNYWLVLTQPLPPSDLRIVSDSSQ